MLVPQKKLAISIAYFEGLVTVNKPHNSLNYGNCPVMSQQISMLLIE